MSKHRGLEAGVVRALCAYRVEKGSSKPVAAAWAEAHKSAGMARMEASLEDWDGRGDEDAPRAAWADLKKWARATP